MKYPKHVWDQIRNITADELINALKKDGWKLEVKKSAIQVFSHPDGKRITIHYHTQKTYKPKLLKALLDDIGWSKEDFKRLKLIKK